MDEKENLLKQFKDVATRLAVVNEEQRPLMEERERIKMQIADFHARRDELTVSIYAEAGCLRRGSLNRGCSFFCRGRCRTPASCG